MKSALNLKELNSSKKLYCISFICTLRT